MPEMTTCAPGPGLAEYGHRMAAHAECFERAAQDPEAVADRRVAERLLLMAAVARAAGHLAGLPAATPETTEETANVDA